MSKKDFKEAYANSDIKELKKYVKKPKVLSTDEIVKYMGDSLLKPKLFDIMLCISFTQYDFNSIVSAIIQSDNIELLEKVLDYDDSLELDLNLISQTIRRGRVSMAKMINEYINDKDDDVKIMRYFLSEHNFVCDPEENSIDSFILAVWDKHNKHAMEILSHIMPNFWNDFAIRFCVNVGNLELVRTLLSHPLVDPGADDNYALKIALKNRWSYNHEIANELLKHPLVNMTNTTTDFVKVVIARNYLYTAERLLRSQDNSIIALFQRQDIIDEIINVHNDITYLAIKLGIIAIEKLLRKYPNDKKMIKKYLRNFHLDEPYALKPYHMNLDPEQIYKMSLEDNDIELATTIVSYPISIRPDILVGHLIECKTNDVCDYILNIVLKQYDPNSLFPRRLLDKCNGPHNLFNTIFHTVKDDPRFDYEQIYVTCNGYWTKRAVRKLILNNCSAKEYNQFCKKYGGD
jgi:hypothetical protein